MTDIATQNSLFDHAISQITTSSRVISGAAHLFAGAKYDTALDKLDLRTAVMRLRAAADDLEGLADRLQGPETAFPDYEAMEASSHLIAAE